MASTFATNFMASTAAVLLDQHGEEVIYTPGNGTGARTIVAMLVRGQLEESTELRGGVGPVVGAIVRAVSEDTDDDAGGGILPSEINTGGDTITLAVDVGATPKAIRIASKQFQAAGMVMLNLR